MGSDPFPPSPLKTFPVFPLLHVFFSAMGFAHFFPPAVVGYRPCLSTAISFGGRPHNPVRRVDFQWSPLSCHLFTLRRGVSYRRWNGRSGGEGGGLLVRVRD